jgi:hypothetical protein
MVTRIDRLARSIGDLQDIVRAVRARGASLKATDLYRDPSLDLPFGWGFPFYSPFDHTAAPSSTSGDPTIDRARAVLMSCKGPTRRSREHETDFEA